MSADEEKAAAWELSERYGAVSSYLDDASFLAAVQALCVAYDAYTAVAHERGWRCVEKKSHVGQRGWRRPLHPRLRGVSSGNRPS